jgi:hypothetical protein
LVSVYSNARKYTITAISYLAARLDLIREAALGEITSEK